MRVIAGSLRGRRLQAPSGAGTRPTADRVKEALFSMLGEIEGAIVLDLFAGTGALGIEALSRGVAAAVFVEREGSALRCLEGNLAALGLAPPQAQVRALDALAALSAAAANGERYDLVFVDPPYSRAGSWSERLASALPGVLSIEAVVVLESDRRSPLAIPLPIERQRRYGDTSITIHRQR